MLKFILSLFRTSLRQVQQRVGYCPQFDALLERLTGRETLTMFARLRGVPEKEIKNAVKTEIDRLDLRPHADKLSGTYRYMFITLRTGNNNVCLAEATSVS